MLSELRLKVAPQRDPGRAQRIVLQNAQADYSQPSWDVAGAIDGNPTTGWALDGQTGKNHVAIFECKTDVGSAAGSLLTFTIAQRFGDGNHELGKFRLSVTTSPRPVRLAALPQNIAKLLSVPAAKRSGAEKAALAAYYRSIDSELARLTQAVARHANDRVNARLHGAGRRLGPDQQPSLFIQSLTAEVSNTEYPVPSTASTSTRARSALANPGIDSLHRRRTNHRRAAGVRSPPTRLAAPDCADI